ncbi:hypothetical protein BGW38_009454 [Lunasporangiospora selenospora]|uniref:Uncharacterized protein n=1 Tax=Lunasporangiospora selenospora TaxID=979761 RepID=A0A9P6FXP7_9FUNG|nr:hypothetical protein BGW38_009454 [Lunasporangiospora selenospora]
MADDDDDRRQRFRFHKDDEILLLEIVLRAKPCPYKISSRDGAIMVAWNTIADEFKNNCKPRPDGKSPLPRTCRSRCDKMIIDYMAMRATPHLRNQKKESREDKTKNDLLAKLAHIQGKVIDPALESAPGNPSGASADSAGTNIVRPPVATTPSTTIAASPTITTGQSSNTNNMITPSHVLAASTSNAIGGSSNSSGNSTPHQNYRGATTLRPIAPNLTTTHHRVGQTTADILTATALILPTGPTSLPPDPVASQKRRAPGGHGGHGQSGNSHSTGSAQESVPNQQQTTAATSLGYLQTGGAQPSTGSKRQKTDARNSVPGYQQPALPNLTDLSNVSTGGAVAADSDSDDNDGGYQYDGQGTDEADFGNTFEGNDDVNEGGLDPTSLILRSSANTAFGSPTNNRQVNRLPKRILSSPPLMGQSKLTRHPSQPQLLSTSKMELPMPVMPSQLDPDDRSYLMRTLALEEQKVKVEVDKIALEREKLALERTRLQWEMQQTNS